jgi:hypothetical protein
MKIDPATFADGLADIIEKVVRPLRDEIAATRKGVTLLPADAAGLARISHSSHVDGELKSNFES